MFVAAIVVVVMILALVAYVAFRKYSVVNQQIEFAAPRNSAGRSISTSTKTPYGACASSTPTARTANCGTWTRPERSHPIGWPPSPRPPEHRAGGIIGISPTSSPSLHPAGGTATCRRSAGPNLPDL